MQALVGFHIKLLLCLNETFLVAGFLVNILLSLYILCRDRQPFSLNQVFGMFCFLFMSLVPLLQYLAAAHPWGWQLSSGVQAKANTLVSCCLLLYLVLFRKPEHKQLAGFDPWPVVFVQRYYGLGNYVFRGAALILILLNFKGLFWRSGDTGIPVNSSLQLIADKLLRGIQLYYTLLTILLFRQQQVSRRQLIQVLILAIISNFPLAVPRYWAATFWMAVLITGSGSCLYRRPWLFRVLLGSCILLVFPVMSLARYSWSYIVQQFSGPGAIFRLSYTGGDFDAYASFCNTIVYVQQQGNTAGRQLLSVLLFFVPRNWWPGKGIGSGALVNRLPGSDFRNFCSPLFAEGYINFGIPGTIFFLLLFAALIRRYDRYYHQSRAAGFSRLFYPASLGMCFFLLRGDLLSSFAYTCGFFLSGWCLHRLLCR